MGGCEREIAGGRLRVGGCECEVASWRLQVGDCKWEVANKRSQVGGCGLPGHPRSERQRFPVSRMEGPLPVSGSSARSSERRRGHLPSHEICTLQSLSYFFLLSFVVVGASYSVLELQYTHAGPETMRFRRYPGPGHWSIHTASRHTMSRRAATPQMKPLDVEDSAGL